MFRIARNPNAQFNEDEAAMLLGVSVQELRALVGNQIMNEEERSDLESPMMFSRADLVVLRVLSSKVA
jgi:hypothetical protein